MLGWGAAVNGQPAPPPSCRPTLAFTQLHPHNPLFCWPKCSIGADRMSGKQWGG